MTIRFLAACALAALGFASPASSQDWYVRLPKDEGVLFKGIVPPDNVGLSRQAGRMAGALAVVASPLATYAAVDASRKEQLEKLQAHADKVLIPYAEVLRSYTHQELVKRAFGKASQSARMKAAGFGDPRAGEGFVEMAPVFFITPDEQAIVLENSIAIYTPGAAAKPVYRNLVKIVSSPREANDLAAYWTADRGEKLKAESASLLAQSLDLAVAQAMGSLGPESEAQKTFRYQEGSARKMERANLVSTYCERVVIKTLRGWLMSVPTRPDAASPAAPCVPAPGNL